MHQDFSKEPTTRIPAVGSLIKIHRALRMSPAMAADVTTRLFDVMDLVNLRIESESQKAAGG